LNEPVDVSKHKAMLFVKKGGLMLHGTQLAGSLVLLGNEAFVVLAVPQVKQVTFWGWFARDKL
jgi:hypothetical protein